MMKLLSYDDWERILRKHPQKLGVMPSPELFWKDYLYFHHHFSLEDSPSLSLLSSGEDTLEDFSDISSMRTKALCRKPQSWQERAAFSGVGHRFRNTTSWFLRKNQSCLSSQEKARHRSSKVLLC